MTLKKLFKTVKEAKEQNAKIGREDFQELSFELFSKSQAFNLSKKELIILLQETLYLLNDKDNNAENELIENVETYHHEAF